MNDFEKDLQNELVNFQAGFETDATFESDVMDQRRREAKNVFISSSGFNDDLEKELAALETGGAQSAIDDDNFVASALGVGTQVVGGFRDAAESIKNLAIDVGGEGVKLLYVDGMGEFTDAQVDQAKNKLKGDTALPNVAESDNTAGQITRGISQFMAPFGLLAKAKYLKGLGKAAPLAQGAVADFIAFEEHEQRLSNVINEAGWGNSITEYLEADPDDSWAEGRFKNALEGAGLGVIADGFFKGVKYIKQGRDYKKTLTTLRETADTRLKDMMGAVDEAKATAAKVREMDVAKFDFSKSRPNKQEISSAAQRRMASAVGTTTEELKQGKVYDKIRKLGVQDQLNKVTMLEEDQFGKTAGAIQDYIARADAGDMTAARDFWMKEGAAFLEVAGAAKDAHQDVARALGARGRSQSVIATNKIIKRLATASAESQEDMMRAFADITNPDQADVFMQGIGKKSAGDLTRDTIHEVYINSILSSPKTLAVDTVGTLLWTPWLALEHLPASAVGFLRHSILGGNADRVFAGETGVMLKSYMGSVMDSWSFVARHAVKGRKGFKSAADEFKALQIDSKTRFDTARGERAITAKNFGKERDSLIGRAIDIAGDIVNTPTSYMQGKDDMAKSVLYRGKVRGLAHRRAAREGLKGVAYNARVKEMMEVPLENVKLADQNLTDSTLGKIARGLQEGDDRALVGASIADQAKQFAREGTFTDDLGPLMTSIQRAISHVPGGKIVFPFIKTPTKLVVRFLERTPAGFAFDSVRADIKAGGARADMALGRIAAGSGLMALSWQFASSGVLTGEGPKNKAERDALLRTGWRPRSIKVGDTYFDVGRLDPLSSFLLMSANVRDISDQMGNDLGADLEKDLTDYFSMGALAFSKMMLSKTWTQSLAELMDAVNREDEKAFERMMYFYGSSIAVPNAVTFFANEVNPIMQEADSLWEQIQIKAGATVRPRTDVFGEVIARDPQMYYIMPSSHASVESDPLHRKLAEAGVYLSMPERRIEGVELSRDQYADLMGYMKELGVKDALRKFADSPLFEALPDVERTGVEGAQTMTKAGFANKIYSEFRKSAQAKLVANNPDLKVKIEKHNRMLQTTGAATPQVQRALSAQKPASVDFGVGK